jgi:hypothetical protein
METRASRKRKLLLKEAVEHKAVRAAMETRASRKRKLHLKEEVEHKAVRAAMETRASRKRKLLLKEAVEDMEDRISNLPDGVLHHILSFLPVQSIGQTSVLSTRWNYLWATFPCLDFSEFSMKKKRRERKREAMELIIKTVLAGRHANFNIKVFRFKGNLGLTYLRDCIHQLVRHSVVELKLCCAEGRESLAHSKTSGTNVIIVFKEK